MKKSTLRPVLAPLKLPAGTIFAVKGPFDYKGVFVGSVDHGKVIIEMRSDFFVKLIYLNKPAIETFIIDSFYLRYVTTNS